MISLKRLHFSLYHCAFFPAVALILVGRLHSCFLTYIKKYMTPIRASIFEKHIKICVYIRHIKSRCKFITLLGDYTQQKQVGWEVIFSEHGFAGSGARKPWWEFEGSALKPFFHVVLRLNGALIVQLKYHIKASVTIMAFGSGKSNHTLARCVFFYQHCLKI